MLWRWMVRRYRVEVALWQCYWGAPEYDVWSRRYCVEHSWLLRIYGALVYLCGYLVIMFVLRGFYYALSR